MAPAIVTPGDVHLTLFIALFVFIIVIPLMIRRHGGCSEVLEQ